MQYFMALALVFGLGVPIAAAGAALGQGKAAAAALESMARQPEILTKVQTAMILALAFIESLVIFSLLIGLLVMGHLPNTADVLKAMGH